MTKQLNLLSLIQAHKNLTPEGFEKFVSYHDVVFKKGEMDDLNILISLLKEKYGCAAADLENFFVGYKIPQIGKEFDLLRFGTNYHINIELKSISTEQKILNQLKRNAYYLKFLGTPVYFLAFEANTNNFYYLKDSNAVEKISLDALPELLQKQDVKACENVDELFNPSDYLVSPFNSTEKFIAGEYFLTKQQEEVRDNILSLIDSSVSENFISLVGGAGTGKTLLAYDIAKNILQRGGKALILHCGQLNDGQQKLIQGGWKISAIKNLKSYDLSKFDLVLIDEAQRIYKPQFEQISKDICNSKGNCIFAYDKLQTLSSGEEIVDASSKISALCGGKIYRLSEKIRTNKEISSFIMGLMDKKRSVASRSNNIEVRYFNSPDDVKNFLSSLNEEQWKVLCFTPSQYNKEFHRHYSPAFRMNSHEVIGQEFEGVAVVIDNFFSYSVDGELIYRGRTHYLATKMLFQNLTRARKRLLIVILQNEEILTRFISIAQ